MHRTKIKGQVEIDLKDAENSDEVTLNGYVYRAIATNYDTKTDSEIIHWYNQRAEDSAPLVKKSESKN